MGTYRQHHRQGRFPFPIWLFCSPNLDYCYLMLAPWLRPDLGARHFLSASGKKNRKRGRINFRSDPILHNIKSEFKLVCLSDCAVKSRHRYWYYHPHHISHYHYCNFFLAAIIMPSSLATTWLTSVRMRREDMTAHIRKLDEMRIYKGRLYPRINSCSTTSDRQSDR